MILTNGVALTNGLKPDAVTVAAATNSDNPALAGDTPTDGAADAVAKPPTAPPDYSPEERAPLTEAERIMLDYISLWNPETALAKHGLN